MLLRSTALEDIWTPCRHCECHVWKYLIALIVNPSKGSFPLHFSPHTPLFDLLWHQPIWVELQKPKWRTMDTLHNATGAYSVSTGIAMLQPQPAAHCDHCVETTVLCVPQGSPAQHAPLAIGHTVHTTTPLHSYAITGNALHLVREYDTALPFSAFNRAHGTMYVSPLDVDSLACSYPYIRPTLITTSNQSVWSRGLTGVYCRVMAWPSLFHTLHTRGLIARHQNTSQTHVKEEATQLPVQWVTLISALCEQGSTQCKNNLPPHGNKCRAAPYPHVSPSSDVLPLNGWAHQHKWLP